MLAAVVLTGASATAQELIVMPYRCAVYDGRPVLTPSEDHGYRVIGQREQRTIRSCSPADPGLCREWALHRFEMDCGGVGVPWTAVIASAYADRVRQEGGQLSIRMPPRWAMAPDDPCARGSSYEGGGWRRGRFDRYCDDRRSLSPPPYVSLPAGFAPMFGINAVFVAARASPGQPLPPPVSAYEGPRSPAPAPGQSTQAPTAPRKNVAVLPAPPPVKEAQPKAAAPAPRSEPITNGEMPPAAPVVTPLSGRPAPDPGRAEPPPASGTIAVPKIINRESAPDPTPARPPVEQRSEAPPASAPLAVETTVVPGPRTPKEKAGIAAFLTGPDAPLVLALAALGSIALVGGIAAWRLGGRNRKHTAPERDLSSISFGSGPQGAVVRSQSTPPPPPSPASSVQFPADPGIGDRMPATRADALRVLGMGVTAGATAAALKKVIDGLRQTWHPDLAQDPQERALRELRMKQLNAAWEILSPKPAQDPTG